MSDRNSLHVVVGAGPLGCAVAEDLLSMGRKVRIVSRSGRAATPLRGAEIVCGDATVPESIASACRGAAVIYHCAKAPYTAWPEKFPPITQGIIAAAAAVGAKLVYADNLYMYGPVSGPLTEDLPEQAVTRKGRTRAEMAEAVLTAHRQGQVQAAIGRAPDFYGPGVLDSALGRRVFEAALRGKPAEVLGDIDAPHTYIYIRDYARGLIALAEHEEACGQVWHIPSAETLTTRQIISLIYKQLGKEPRFRIAPKPLVSFLALLNAEMREIKEMLYQFEQPFVVDHSKFASRFGATVTPHEQAIEKTLEWYRMV